MLDKYIKNVEYEDLSEIQQKTILDRLNAEEYQGKPGIIPDVLDNDLDQSKLNEIMLNHRVIISAKDGFIVLEYIGQNIEDDESLNFNATPYFHPIVITSDDVVVTKPNLMLFSGVFGDTFE